MKRIHINHINEGADPTLGGVSYNVQGTPGYVYQILNLNHSLEQKTNNKEDFHYIYPGCKVRGVGANNKDLHYTGIVNRIVKNENGEIQYIYIRCLKNNKMVTILADDNLELLLNNKEEQLSGRGFQISPSYNVNRL